MRPIVHLRRRARHATATVVAVACGVLACALIVVPAARGAKPPGTLNVTASPNLTVTPANYTIGQMQAKKETITGYTITFPSDTDVSLATTAQPGDTITRNIAQRSVTITLGTPIVGGANGTNFSAYVNNIRNPSVQSTTYTLTIRLNIQGGAARTLTSAPYAIVTAPYLSITLSTLNASNTINFGALDPGQTSAEATAVMHVIASGPYTITRSISGDTPSLNPVIAGGGEINGLKAGGEDWWTDTMTVTPQWVADPGNKSVSILYTVILN